MFCVGTMMLELSVFSFSDFWWVSSSIVISDLVQFRYQLCHEVTVCSNRRHQLKNNMYVTVTVFKYCHFKCWYVAVFNASNEKLWWSLSDIIKLLSIIENTLSATVVSSSLRNWGMIEEWNGINRILQRITSACYKN